MNKTLGLCLLTLGVCASMVFAARWREKTAVPDLGLLDKAIHARFDVPDGFGMGRMVPPPSHAKTPILASAAARDAAAKLKAEGWDVDFYLGGRNLLPHSDNTRAVTAVTLIEIDPKTRRSRTRHELTGPITVAIGGSGEAAPDRAQIVLASRQALQAMLKDEKLTEYRSNAGDWNLLMRPVNGTKKECVSCHFMSGLPKMPIGAVLGVKVYAYRRAQ